MEKLKNLDKDDIRALLIRSIPFIVLGYVANKASWLYGQTNPSMNPINRGMAVVNYFSRAFSNPLPSFLPKDLLFGFGVAAIAAAFIAVKKSEKKKFRHGTEYGSAAWGNKKDIKPFMDADFWKNIILADGIYMMLSSRPKKPEYARNKNVLVIGGSGSGKTRFFIKPNLMQMNCSYVITDPKGTVILECGKMLARGTKKLKVKTNKDGIPLSDKKGQPIYETDSKGNPVYEKDKNGKYVYEPYKIKVLNTINFKKSMHYNPFAYISAAHPEQDIMKLVTALINNTKGEGDKSGEDFWVKAEKLLYCAYIGYIYYEAPIEERNFNTLLEMINASETRESQEDFKNAVDMLFDELEERNPAHYAVRMYKKYKLAAGKTAKSILISCGARLAPFDIKELRDLTAYDELELDLIGDRKTAMFVIISDTDSTFNFLVSIMYTQMFNLLCERADDKYGGRLPVHVRCLLDEFANIGQIPQFDKLIATIRSREISASIVLQAKSQLKSIYKDNADTIEGNCDTTLFLGGKEGTTLKEMSEMLGKETIDIINTSDTRGTSRSYGLNNQKTGRDLMSKDELAVMSRSECIVQIGGLRAFKEKKYDITKHPHYPLLSDYNEKNTFDIEKYMGGSLDISKHLNETVNVMSAVMPDYDDLYEEMAS